MNKTKLMMAISIAWILSACAKGQMTEEQTQKTVAEGQKVIIASNDYFNSLIALQIQSASIIYATHPECNFRQSKPISTHHRSLPLRIWLISC